MNFFFGFRITVRIPIRVTRVNILNIIWIVLEFSSQSNKTDLILIRGNIKKNLFYIPTLSIIHHSFFFFFNLFCKLLYGLKKKR